MLQCSPQFVTPLASPRHHAPPGDDGRCLGFDWKHDSRYWAGGGGQSATFLEPVMTVCPLSETDRTCPCLLSCAAHLAPSHPSVRQDTGHSSSSVLETAELLCCAGVICSSFKCSDGTQHPAPSTQHLAALLRGRVSVYPRQRHRGSL